jgi:hypothetical protein
MTSTSAALGTLPGPATLASVQGTLALDLVPRHDPPEAAPQPGRPGGDVVPIDRQRRRRLVAWTHRYAQAVVEIVEGDRPVTQVLRWTVPEVYHDLARRAVLVARAGGHVPGQGRPAGPVVRPQVVGVRTCFVTPDKVEVSVRVRHGQRSRAIAARFELIAGRWQCSALEFA